jgi:hypothetical protein
MPLRACNNLGCESTEHTLDVENVGAGLHGGDVRVESEVGRIVLNAA